MLCLMLRVASERLLLVLLLLLLLVLLVLLLLRLLLMASVPCWLLLHCCSSRPHLQLAIRTCNGWVHLV
jgi:hypothetical protein